MWGHISEHAHAGGPEDAVRLLEHIGTGAVFCLAHAARLLWVVLGSQHPMTESSAFCAFFAGLPYSVASVITRAAQQLS
jgi:hypothetical protein